MSLELSKSGSTASPQWHALTGFPSVGALEVVSATPARFNQVRAFRSAPYIGALQIGRCSFQVIQLFNNTLF